MLSIEGPGGRPVSEGVRTGASGYQGGRAVERVAAVTAARYAPETLAQMHRLADLLASGEPLREDVPPGTYFNALV